jgi:hypothetical protein
MLMDRAALFAVMVSCLLSATPAGAATWLVVRAADGTTVQGELVSRDEHHIVLLVLGRTVEIPVTPDVTVSEPIELGAPPVGAPAAALDRTWRAPANPSTAAVDPVALQTYEAQRLVLCDRRGHEIGPSHLGFPSEDFGRQGDERYRVVGEGGEEWSWIRLVEAAGTEAQRLEVEDRLRELRHRRARGLYKALGSGFPGATGIGLLVVGAALSSQVPNGVGGVPPGAVVATTGGVLLGTSIPVAAFAFWGARRNDGKADAMDDPAKIHKSAHRSEAWALVDVYNRALRRRLQLPDALGVDRGDR